jgi:hypothetical protein
MFARVSIFEAPAEGLDDAERSTGSHWASRSGRPSRRWQTVRRRPTDCATTAPQPPARSIVGVERYEITLDERG